MSLDREKLAHSTDELKKLIAANGGREERRTTRYVYFIIDANIIYRR